MSSRLAEILFVALHLVGGALICVGLFLYEDEENNFQNRIEQWWKRLDVIQKASRSKVASFMQEVARLTEAGFDRVFGRRLFSLQVIPVSIYLSIASLFLLVLLIWPWMKYSGPITRYTVFRVFAYFLGLALVPAFVRNRWLLAVWWAIIPVFLLSVARIGAFIVRTHGPQFALRGLGYVSLFFGWSLLCDLGYIALTRFALSRAKAIDHVGSIVTVVIANLLASAIPLLSPIYAGVGLFKFAPNAGAAVMVSVVFNSIDVFAGLAAVMVAALLLLHRLFWPAIQRPLYAVYRYSPLKQKKWLVGVGIALVFLPKHLTVEAIKALVEKLI
jgi:hypothetical protein